MNQSFLLKEYGKLDLWEQNQLTAEERKWWIERINQEIEKRNKQQEASAGTTRPHTPGQPTV